MNKKISLLSMIGLNWSFNYSKNNNYKNQSDDRAIRRKTKKQALHRQNPAGTKLARKARWSKIGIR